MSNIQAILTLDGMEALIAGLRARGFQVLGPTVRDQAIVYDEIASTADLPIGWTDQQDGGHYRLRRRDDTALFGYAVGPHAWKQFLHPPLLQLWRAERQPDRLTFSANPPPSAKMAFLGVRACELQAIAIQDKVFLGGPYIDPHYQARRDGLFVVAVNCGQAGGTCFCASMGSGPRAGPGFDLALTELLEGEHRFLVEAGTLRGQELVESLPHRPTRAEDVAQAAEVVARTTASMGRQMPAENLHDLLLTNLEHPRWDEVAGRCLTCGNCTQVCPTCFCTAVSDSNDLATGATERVRRWDSCFSVEFAYIHGGSVRASPRARYRQWMTHKLAHWVDQFGTSGCVGCGRCITWCPVGIDLTEEAHAIAGQAVEESHGRT